MTQMERMYSNHEAVHRAMDAMNLVSDARLTVTAVATMLVIARRINSTTGIGFTSYETIVSETHVSSATATRAVKTLVELGLLERTSGGMPNRANRYRLGPNVPEFLAAEKPTTAKASSKPLAGRIKLNYE